jgi:hypothetical protein
VNDLVSNLHNLQINSKKKDAAKNKSKGKKSISKKSKQIPIDVESISDSNPSNDDGCQPEPSHPQIRTKNLAVKPSRSKNKEISTTEETIHEENVKLIKSKKPKKLKDKSTKKKEEDPIISSVDEYLGLNKIVSHNNNELEENKEDNSEEDDSEEEVSKEVDTEEVDSEEVDSEGEDSEEEVIQTTKNNTKKKKKVVVEENFGPQHYLFGWGLQDCLDWIVVIWQNSMQSGRIDKSWLHQLRTFKLIDMGTANRYIRRFEPLERNRRMFDYIGFYIYTSSRDKTFLCVEIDENGALILTNYETWKIASNSINNKRIAYKKKHRKSKTVQRKILNEEKCTVNIKRSKSHVKKKPPK